MRFSQFGIFQDAADDKMKNNSLIAFKFDMLILDGEIHFLNQKTLTLSKKLTVLWQIFGPKKSLKISNVIKWL